MSAQPKVEYREETTKQNSPELRTVEKTAAASASMPEQQKPAQQPRYDFVGIAG